MAEIKNTFLAAKMNKDIDSRLMPKNEYRHAINLEINKTDNSDAGTIQNVLGNFEIKDFKKVSDDLECIGIYADNATDTLYIFLTNNLDTSGGNVYNNAAENYIYSYNTLTAVTTLLVEGPFLNFSKNSKVLGINVLENLLFWTDNRNQPRKINIDKASNNIGYYTREEQISVAKPSPTFAALLYKQRPSDAPIAPNSYETTMYNVTDQLLPNGTTNPYYDVNYIGDSAYLSDKMVRFSYRYKFEDGEYSIMAPFTQIAYIPKQDGYFLYKAAVGSDPEVNDETAAYRSTIVSFMQNKVNQIDIQIPLPCPANQLNSLFKISSIEILYKESDGVAVSAVDSIPVQSITGTSTTYEYAYNSKKPFKTLPNKDVIRVNDITPIKALGQEIIGNRVVYSNYQNKNSYPKYLNYNVGCSNKSTFSLANGTTSRIEYPNHSLKENRNYQVGVVLADRFGRESGVILSDALNSTDPTLFGGSSLYFPYRKYEDTAPSQFPGSSLKVLFNNPIDSTMEGWPGIYEGDSTKSTYNPLGWYSYKIVVKQTEQEYYNVYLPGVMASYPFDVDYASLTERGVTSHTVLLNDNINKVPRDLTEVGPAQLQFRSSVTLYPRVINTLTAFDTAQAYPGTRFSFVNTIATNNSLFFSDGIIPTSLAGYDQFYQLDSNPLIARISTPSTLGVYAYQGDGINLAVFETKPFDSKLDIYWETSTSGIIAELNAKVYSGTNSAEFIQVTGPTGFQEVISPGTTIIPTFYFEDSIGNPITPSSVTLTAVRTNNGYSGVPVTKFNFINEGGGNYSVKVTSDLTKDPYFYYNYGGLPPNTYTFYFSVVSGSPSVTKTFTVQAVMTNNQPTISTGSVNTNVPIVMQAGVYTILELEGFNGANPNGPYSHNDLTWSLIQDSPSGTSPFYLYQVKNPDGTDKVGYKTLKATYTPPPEGTYNLRVLVTDAGGLTYSRSITVQYPYLQSLIFTPPPVWNEPSNGNVTGTVRATGATYYIYLKITNYTAGNTDTLQTILNVTINGVTQSITATKTGTGSAFSTATIEVLPGQTYSYLYQIFRPSSITGASLEVFYNTTGIIPTS